MPMANNNGIRIHYEVEGSGPPLLLHHGSSGSGADWRDFEYVDPLKGSHKLILMDARGSGGSDKPHDPAAYDMALRVRDVIAVLDDLAIHQTHYFGYSLGGWIGFGLGKYAPQRFRSLILGGAHPYAENMQAARDRMPQDPEAFMASTEKMYGASLTPGMRERLGKSDLDALSAMTRDRESLEDALPKMRMPCLLYAGDADPRFPKVQECAAKLSDATFFPLSGCDHVCGFIRSDLVLPHISTFLAHAKPPHDLANRL